MTKTVEDRERVVVRFAGDSGDGMQLAGTRFTDATAVLGNDLATLPNFVLPGDVSASKRYWKQDIIRPAVETTARGTIEIRDDPGFGFVESQPRRLQPLGQPCPDLLGLLPGMTAYDQVIGVPDERRAAVLHRSGMNAAPVSDACGLLQPVQCDIQQQRRNNAAL